MRRPVGFMGDIVSLCSSVVARWRGSDAEGSSSEAILFQELLGTAALVAASASIATAMRDGRRVVDAAIERDIWLPGEPTHFQRLGEDTGLANVHRQLFAALRGAYGLVEFAREMSLRLFMEFRKGRAGAAQAEVICDAWLRACGHILVAIYEFQRLRPALVSEPSFARMDGVVRLLNAARAGQAPCLSADGTISVGSWAERRAAPRHGVDIEVAIEIAGETCRARLTDVGSGGLGLAGIDRRCDRGELILVTLPSGRRLPGEVRWQRDDRIGLALLDPLSSADELFAAMSRPRPNLAHDRRPH